MAQLLTSQGDAEVVGSKGVVKKVEFVRIIAEALYSLGYSRTGAHLEEESGISLHSTVVNLFRQQILDGQWDNSVATLHKIGLDETAVKNASFMIWTHKFLELLYGEKIMDALTTMRIQIAPLGVYDQNVRELSFWLLSPDLKIYHGNFGQESGCKQLLNDLQKVLPPSTMVPKERLVYLVEQGIDLQCQACDYHNLPFGKMSLLSDHHCGMYQIPSQTVQVLEQHSGEVWFLQFSHNGKYMASSDSDFLVIIWEVEVNGRISLKHRLFGHQKPVSYISWSRDDRQLITCGVEEMVRRWDATSGECLHVYKKSGQGCGLISCEWAPDGKSVFSGVTDKSIIMWDQEGREVEFSCGYKTTRISDLGMIVNGKVLITVCKVDTLLLLGLESKSVRHVEENQPIVSFALSEDAGYLLVSLLNEELHLWDIKRIPVMVTKYLGHRHARYVVRSCFGGVDQGFIASGSEDSLVLIWHRRKGKVVQKLHGHSAVVNCVSWNPVDPHMLASGSDDGTIRIWGITKTKADVQNAVH